MSRQPTSQSVVLSRAFLRGFTLTELMAVVAIVGILSVLAVVGFQKYLRAAHSSEAVTIIGAIRVAQESYRAETLQYLNVSNNLNTFFPKSTPDDRKTGWGGADGDALAQRWRLLNVTVDGPVNYVYAVVAGAPGAAIPVGDLGVSTKPNFPNPVEPWYVVQAKGDINNNGVFSWAVGSSFSGEVYRENEDE